MRRARLRATVGAGVALVALGACDQAPTRPEATGATRSIEVTAQVRADGVATVQSVVTFADGAGGVVELRAPVLATISEVRVDGNPRSITVGQYPVEVTARRRTTTLAYRLEGAAERFDDVAVVTLPVWGVPSDASGADEPVEVSGEVSLPGAPVADGVHLHGALDPEVSVSGSTLRFRGRLAWPRDADLVAVIPAEEVSALPVLPGGERADDVLEEEQLQAREESGFAEEIEDRRRREDLIAGGYWALVGAEILIPFLVAAPRLFRSAARRRRAVKDVPPELMDPPGRQTPAVVALLARDGHDIGYEAAAATVLDLAQRGVVKLDGVTSDRYEVVAGDGTAATEAGEEQLVRALREAADAEGRLVGPPLRIDPRGDWWTALRRDTLRRARAERLVERRYPSGAFLTSVVLLTATTLPLWARSPEAAVGGLVVAGILCMLPFVGGYVLTATGHRVRAEWEAFGRRAAAASEIETAPPRAVAIWGPYLIYGAALGVAKVAVEDLRPEGVRT